MGGKASQPAAVSTSISSEGHSSRLPASLYTTVRTCSLSYVFIKEPEVSETEWELTWSLVAGLFASLSLSFCPSVLLPVSGLPPTFMPARLYSQHRRLPASWVSFSLAFSSHLFFFFFFFFYLSLLLLSFLSCSVTFPTLTNVTSGEDDGTLSCSLILSEDPKQSVDIEFMVTDISLYPKEHEFLIYTTSEDVPQYVTEVLEQAQQAISRLEIPDMLSQLSYTFQNKIEPEDDGQCDFADDLFLNDDEDSVYSGIEDAIPDLNDDEYHWSPVPQQTQLTHSDTITEEIQDSEELLCKISEDLKTAKLAGFRVGYLGNKLCPIVSVSCRISKLGISEDAMKAWHIKEEQYLVCLIRYIGKYQSLENLLLEDELSGKSSVEMFDQVGQGAKSRIAICGNSPPNNDDITQFWSNLVWSRTVFNECQGKPVGSSDPISHIYQEPDISEEKAAMLPRALSADHLLEKNGSGASFPLIAMQFMLRHFVRCTEFCLVCHCKTNDNFEALKPYVCSKSLCLFQYMTLGFGPSLEWEIMTQPYVVDLLVSFTYSSAIRSRLVDPPTGLGIMVPGGMHDANYKNLCNDAAESTAISHREIRFEVSFDESSMTMNFAGSVPGHRVCTGDWLVIIDEGRYLHCRVTNTSFWPSVDISSPIKVSKSREAIEDKTMPIPKLVKAAWYGQNFDDLSPKAQHQMVVSLLDTLPTVVEMKQYLMENSRGSQPTLTQWKDRISKSALDLLRWIVASNRSCIIQDDPDPTEDSVNADQANDDRVGGVPGYMQFRFAQGAPDKEERFFKAVMAKNKNFIHPHATIFAWHGSHLSNWHGILREGLHFKEIMHGRAFGDGVYMSTSFTTSAAYISPNLGLSFGSPTETWPNSKLGVTGAISLNEVVNSPSEFVNTSPHLVVSQLDWIQTRYLFVRCSLNKEIGLNSPSKLLPYYHQDPKYVALGPNYKTITIPLSAFSQKRRLALGMTAVSHPPASTPTNLSTKQGNGVASSSTKRANSISKSPIPRSQAAQGPGSTSGSANSHAGVTARYYTDNTTSQQTAGLFTSDKPNHAESDGYLSDETDVDDLNIHIEADSIRSKQARGNNPEQAPEESGTKGKNKAQNETDFIPGTLDPASLPMIAAPDNATPSATASLQRDLRGALRIQDNEPLADLGWYIDPNLVNNVYQWIVELHSFDPSLPLSKDMAKAGIKSVVLEVRFPQQYPMSPPFVRVIRPRFLGFQQGGGGHVTAGGALCMELLTNSGWSAVSSIESVLLQVRLAISSTDPQPARLVPGQDARKGRVLEYGVAEAVEAFIRACKAHGWQIPADFHRESKASLAAEASSYKN
ncbi:ubiquitin conjugating enzyme, putative [Trichophyton verrucosum HKI 0517]|uniref:Ubiquitin conjugating enzyme, putative n=1 Tax=Trichophyton verrucosum (strain HKI 0517) TaxID=663202 RepID=D4DFD3_TRIVH|nr:ubiquitin conjugating enzyme, putative [Trichophyton verrucosum HKI 0517]EFE39482.1 ubiquitin conjugating enzyme, putative [Trichophyton verrucosum HKI 0517]